MSKTGFVTLRYPASTRQDIPPGAQRLARERTKHLHRHVEMPVLDLLANAYLQGITDAVYAIERRGGLPE